MYKYVDDVSDVPGRVECLQTADTVPLLLLLLLVVVVVVVVVVAAATATAAAAAAALIDDVVHFKIKLSRASSRVRWLTDEGTDVSEDHLYSCHQVAYI
jgi:hypothetical protein